MRKLTWLRFAIGMMALFVFQLASATTTITGTVTVEGPAATVAPIQGVMVLVSRPGFPKQILATANTNAQGAYTISKLMAGTYQITFSNNAYAQAVMSSFTFPDNSTYGVNAQLVPALIGKEQKVNNEKQEEIFQIHNPNHYPVTYTWLLPTSGLTGTAVANPGDSNLTTPGTLHVDHIELFVDNADVQPIQVTDVPPPVIISNITGTVDKSDGSHLDGVTVTLSNLFSGQTVATTTTLGDGSYVFHNEPAGTYNITYSRHEYTPYAQVIVEAIGGLVAPTVYLVKAPPPSTATAAIDVTDTNHSPVPNVTVKIAYANNTSVSGLTDGNGNIVFSGQPVGIAGTITATTNDGTNRSDSITTSGFVAGTNMVGLTLQAVAYGQVTGVVTNASNALLSGVNVAVLDANNNVLASGVTGSNGAYNINNITAGTVTLSFSLTGYVAYTLGGVVIPVGHAVNEPNVVLQSALQSTVNVNVVDSDGYQVTANVSISYSNGGMAGPSATDNTGFVSFTSQQQNVQATVTATASDGSNRTASVSETFAVGANSVLVVLPADTQGSITGTLTDSTTGNPIAGATVSAVDSRGNGQASVTTNSQGQYTLAGLEMEPYTLAFSDSGYQGQTSAPITPDASDNIALVPTTATVNITVLDANGNPFGGATVTITYANGATPAMGTSNSNGLIQIADQPVGIQATLSATTTDGRNASGTATFSEGANSDTLNLSNPVGAVSGVVIDATTSQPVTGASVAVVDYNNNPVTTLTTDNQGAYSVSGLSPGSYTFTYSQTNYETLTLTVAVTGGVTTTSNASLTEEPGAVTGTVTGSISQSRVPNCVITLNGPATASTTTDANGVFNFPSLPPGNYTGTLVEGIFNQSISVTVVSGQTATMNLILDTSSVAGHITDQFGNNLAGVTVILTDGSFTSSLSVTDSGGNFVVNRENNTGNLTLTLSYTDPNGNVWPGSYSFTIGSFNPPEWVVGTITINVGP